MLRKILSPLIFASGVSLLLYSHNQNLTLASYLAPFPFWALLGRPMGLFWNQHVLKELNRDVFPAEMKNYRELYLVSRRAIAYDLLFNHTIYNPLQAVLIAMYSYAARQFQQTILQQKKEAKSLWTLLTQRGPKLLQIRVLVSIASVVSQYWLSFWSLQRSKEGVGLATSAKRLLLIKQMLLNMGWHSYLLKIVNENYLL